MYRWYTCTCFSFVLIQCFQRIYPITNFKTWASGHQLICVFVPLVLLTCLVCWTPPHPRCLPYYLYTVPEARWENVTIFVPFSPGLWVCAPLGCLHALHLRARFANWFEDVCPESSGLVPTSTLYRNYIYTVINYSKCVNISYPFWKIISTCNFGTDTPYVVNRITVDCMWKYCTSFSKLLPSANCILPRFMSC